METTGIIKDIQKDYKTDKPVISFLIDQLPSDIEDLGGNTLDIIAQRHREKRSQNANAYFHVLVTKIAAAVGANNTAVKNRLIREYGAFEYIDDQIPTFKLKAEYEAEMLNREGIHVKTVGRMYEDGCEWVRLAFMRGSHTYDSAEMARLIDGTVEEAKGLGIETLTPDALERMKATWTGKDS